MSEDYFALYESPNIVIVPTVTSTTRKDLHPTPLSAAVAESSTIQQIVTEEPETFNLFVSDRHVPTTTVGGNINCVDTATHFNNLKNLPLSHSKQNEVTISYSKYSSHNNLVDLTCSNHLNTNETPSKSISNLNINQIIDNGEDTKPIEQKEWGLYHISRVHTTGTYPNTVTNNNMNPITESNSTEKELKHMSKHKKGNLGSSISQSPKKRSYHESNSENSKNQEDEKEIGLKQRKVLKPVSINKKNDSDQQSIDNKREYISKHNLNTQKSASTAQKLDKKNERKSISPNKEFLHATLSEAQKSKLTAGALKRYLDYQRFLAKYYNTFDKNECGDEKNTNTCTKDLKSSEKSINNNRFKPKHENMKTENTVERKHEESNVKANVERIKHSSRDSDKKSNVERKQNKEESNRKRYEDKTESSDQSTSRNDRKNKKENYNEKSMKRMEKKEELKIKFTSYCQKKKKKSIDDLDKNKIATDKRYAQCSDRKKKPDDEVIDSSKYKKQKEETIKKSYDNSEIKRIEETKKKMNKTKQTGLKRKITGSEPEDVKKNYKRDAASVIDSCQRNSDIESSTLPIRTVDVKEKATFQNSCKDKKDLRSKLSRKITKSQYNTESTPFKLTPTRENLIVTVKQDVLAAPSSANVQSVSKEIKKSKAKKNVQTVNKKEIKKPKARKTKKIKLVINIKCPNSEDSDGIASETSTSPHPDLSFLDDLDIDGIVDSLNAGQSPIHSNVDVEDLNTANNYENRSPGLLEKDCPHVALHEPDLLRNTRKLKERSIANADKSLLSASYTNENVVEACNDDIYEVINITDDSDLEDVEESTTNITQDMSIIYIDDDSRDETESTHELKNENVVISENTENMQNIVAQKNKHNVTNIPDIGDNKTELPDAKYLVTQTAPVNSSARTDAVETKYPVQEDSKIKDSDIKKDSNTEGDKIFGNNRRIKSENLEEPPTSSPNVRELMPYDVQNTSKTIKNENLDGIIVKTEDIEKSQKVLIPSSSIQERMNNNIANTIVNTKTEPIENLEEPQSVATSNSNVREQIRDGVDLLKNIKKEETDVIVKTEEKHQNDLTTSSHIHEVTNTINKPIEKMNTAITIKSERSPVPVQPNIDDINLAKVMTAENDEIIKESSLIVKISEDRVIKQNSTSNKYEGNPNKRSAEITVGNKNKSKDSEKLEVKNTKKQAKPGDVILTKSTSSNIQEHNTKQSADNTTLNIITERKVKESSSMLKTSEDKAVHVKPNSAASMRECDGNLNKHNAEINVASKNKPNDSEKLEAKNTKKHAKPGDVIITKSILTTAIIKSKDSSVPSQPNTDDVNLANVVNAEKVEIKESSSIMKKSEDKVIKPNSASSKTEENLSKHCAETTIPNNNKPKGSEKPEAKNTKKQAKPGDVIISKPKIEKNNPVTESANFNTKNNVLNMYTNDKLKKNIAKVLKKKIPKKVKPAKTEVEVVPIKSEAKDIVYWNKIEQRMFEYLQRKFSLIKLIHTGYFSSIYTCKDDKGGIYAIKILKRKFQSMAIYKDKMLMDLQQSTDRKQYFLLSIINSFNIHGEWCFLSEYYPKTLEETLAQGKKKNTICFHIDVVQNLSRQLVAAVCTLTSNLLVHSDIKPAHILLNSSHTKLKLCGFDRMDYNYNIKIIPSTGTASYRAPEIIMGYEADYKIDVWSTALVMFEMASGSKLFPGCFNNDILFKQISTLGPMPYEMIENSSLAFIYFYGTKFMKQIGTSEWIFVPFTDENYRIRKGPFTSYHKTWAPSRSHLQITEDLDKIEMLHRLLQIMLVLDPRHRIPITYVAANEFIFHNDMIPY